MFAEANGIQIHYELDGPVDGPMVTMSHSLAATLKMWDWQMSVLCKRYRVLRYDIRGHGRTDAPEEPYSIELLAADLLALLGSLRIDSTHFVGLSMGGMIGQAAVLEEPDRFKSLVLCDTSSRMPSEMAPVWDRRARLAEHEGMKALIKQTIERWFSREFEMRAKTDIHKIRMMIRDTPVAGFRGCCYAISALDLTDRLSEIRQPTLLIVGEDDPGTPVEVHEVMHSKITGSKLVILPDALHLSNVEQCDAFNAALIEFLDEHNDLG